MRTNWGLACVCGCGLLFAIAGCNQGSAPAVANNANEETGTFIESPNLEISVPPELQGKGTIVGLMAPSATASEPPPAEGTPEWQLLEIAKVRLLPLPSLEGDDRDDDTDEDSGNDIKTTSASDVEKPAIDDPATTEKTAEERAKIVNQIRVLRRERNQQVIQLATDAIRQTAKDPAKEPVFLAAVQQLLDARLQLALQGDEESINALYEAANAFYAKRPESAAAAEAQITVVNLAHASALRYAKTEPKWIQEFARQAELYATRFGDDAKRVLPLLMAAGRSCESNGLVDEAKSCFALIQSKYPESPQALQSAGVLRRMSLVGKKLELAGPTLDGNYLSIDDFAGKAVIVVFWSSTATPFVEQSPQIQAVCEKYKKYANVLSVSLDSEESDIDAFREKSGLTWPVIFHVEQDQRGWNAPLAKYYGVTSLPTIWIVDPKGNVAETQISAAEFEPKLRAVLLRNMAPATTKADSSTDKN